VRAARGFTLIEVLVALAIVAIGMSAVLEALTSSANTAMYLQEKTFAEWVALNRIETVRLSGTIPAPGTSSDNIDYAGRSWQWQQKVTSLPRVPGMVQIDVDVRPADSKASEDRGWYASAAGFMSNAIAPPTNPPPPAWSQQPILGVPPASSGGQPGGQPVGNPGNP
jgi:general secretion pathway protein I